MSSVERKDSYPKNEGGKQWKTQSQSSYNRIDVSSVFFLHNVLSYKLPRDVFCLRRMYSSRCTFSVLNPIYKMLTHDFHFGTICIEAFIFKLLSLVCIHVYDYVCVDR